MRCRGKSRIGQAALVPTLLGPRFINIPLAVWICQATVVAFFISGDIQFPAHIIAQRIKFSEYAIAGKTVNVCLKGN